MGATGSSLEEGSTDRLLWVTTDHYDSFTFLEASKASLSNVDVIQSDWQVRASKKQPQEHWNAKLLARIYRNRDSTTPTKILNSTGMESLNL